MADLWDVDAKVYYIQEDGVLKARVKRRLNTGEADYLLQNQKNLKVSEMHRTREDAERALAARQALLHVGNTVGANAQPAAGGDKKQECMTQGSQAAGTETPPATGGEKKEDGMTKDSEDSPVVAGAAKEEASEDVFSDGNDPDAEVGNMPNFSPEVEAELFTRKVSEWLTSLTSKALERGVFVPTILTEIAPSAQRRVIQF